MATAKTPVMIQIDDLVREATDAEIAEIQAQQIEATAQITAQETKAAARQSALAKLAELGLTAEEIAAL